jgi:hypothetical protein
MPPFKHLTTATAKAATSPSSLFPPTHLSTHNAALKPAKRRRNSTWTTSTGRTICRFFNYYLSLKNGEPFEQICALFTQAWDASYADETGQWRGDDHYTISDSYAYASTTDAFVAPVCPSDLSQLDTPEKLEFCASYIGYAPPVETSNIVATVSTVTIITATETSTSTPPPVTVTNTVLSSGETTVVVATETKVVTALVTAAAKKRALATPALVANWAPEKISAACSKVATSHEPPHSLQPPRLYTRQRQLPPRLRLTLLRLLQRPLLPPHRSSTP